MYNVCVRLWEVCHLIVIHVSCVCFVSYTILCERPSCWYSGLGLERTEASFSSLSAVSDVRNTEHLCRRTDIADVLYVKGTYGSVADSQTSPSPRRNWRVVGSFRLRARPCWNCIFKTQSLFVTVKSSPQKEVCIHCLAVTCEEPNAPGVEGRSHSTYRAGCPMLCA